MRRWVSFKELRERLDFATVLRDHGVELAVKGDQAGAFCPLPGHQERSKRKSRSFSVNLKKGIFQCFGCQAKGNVLDFAVLMAGGDPEDGDKLREVALELQDRYLDGHNDEEASAPAVCAEETPEPESTGERVINAPLGFTLKSIDAGHPYLQERGLQEGTIARFGIGYCAKGLMQGRIAIPLHDAAGELIGYAGRLVEEGDVNSDVPKYKLPGGRKVGEVMHEFRKSEFLFNGHRLAAPLRTLLVVEGFFGAMWLYQCGFRNVVALMGASCSARQGALITGLVAEDGLVCVMPDGDSGGKACALSVFEQTGSARRVHWIRLEEGSQPDSFSGAELHALLDRVYAEEHDG